MVRILLRDKLQPISFRDKRQSLIVKNSEYKDKFTLHVVSNNYRFITKIVTIFYM